MKKTLRISRVSKLSIFFLLVFLSIIAIGCVNLDSSSDNKRALEDLREAGSDLSQAHPFDFYLYHPDEGGAVRICKELSSHGFKISVREGALGGEWLCLASYMMLPSIENLTQMELLFEELISVHGGEYDGWETTVISK